MTTERRSSQPRRRQARVLVLPQTLTVQRLSELTDQNPIDVIKQLMRNGIMAAMNQVIDYQMATLVTSAFGISTTMAEDDASDASQDSEQPEEVDQTGLVTRTPVVTILGHVDHGKTALLDSIRDSSVAERELGGITQHIGAYQVEANGQLLTFLDTPGHEAFTAIRARGSKATDIAILVVAADDGIMPQTDEAIDHAKAAGVPIVVAINKMDMPAADPERVKRQLSERDMLVEDWGGEIISVEVSAKTGDGITDLLENIAVVAEIADLKANPDKPASGVIIEAKLDRQRGPTATLLVQDGTLSVGQHVTAGGTWGRVRAMSNDRGEAVKQVLPGTPAEILGFGSLPEAGDLFSVVPNERTARAMATDKENPSSSQQAQARALTLDEVVNRTPAGELKELNLVLKADVQGSVEAVNHSLENLAANNIKVRILHASSGGVTETDVLLASASEAIIIAFNVGTEPGAERLARRMGVEIRNYGIIYQLIDDVELALQGLLEPAIVDVVLGRAEIREVFPTRGGVKIAGCRIVEGRMTKGVTVRITRDGKILEESTVTSLRHFRDEINEAALGTECGVVLQGFNDFEEGDVLEAHREERARR
ncbi:MAG TPA: translation initiation factor IF-2 [Dehalococcoidia bacterium]|nr:translation initiation factor IF-2 [Dehalococcoidia bacterium]HAI99421.1 translation initiation factor IF-2 [Dehalococcoidia bacterium]